MHVQNITKKMRINSHSTMVPFLVMVNLMECSNVDAFDVSNLEMYHNFRFGGSHFREARRQLIMEHLTTYFFKYAECKIYVGLTMDEAKLLAWNNNNHNDYRQKISSIERIRFFQYEYLDIVRQYDPNLNPSV